jgi:hypothetical protein
MSALWSRFIVGLMRLLKVPQGLTGRDGPEMSFLTRSYSHPSSDASASKQIFLLEILISPNNKCTSIIIYTLYIQGVIESCTDVLTTSY